MDQNAFEKAAKKAEKMTQSVSDPELRKIAFKEALSSLLGRKKNETLLGKKGRTGTEESKDEEIRPFDIKKIAAELRLEKKFLESAIDFDGSDAHILIEIPGKKEWEKQLNATLIIMTLRYVGKNDREILAINLKKELMDLGIGTANLATTLKSEASKYITRKTTRGSHDSKYRLTNPGRKRGLEILKAALSGENKDNC